MNVRQTQVHMYVVNVMFSSLDNLNSVAKNPLGENECDSKRPNIFVDRNNLLGKPQALVGPQTVNYQYGTGPMGS